MENSISKIKIKKGYLLALVIFLLFVFSNFYLLQKITDTQASNNWPNQIEEISPLYTWIKEDLKDSLKTKFYVNKPDMSIEDFKKEVIRIIDIFIK